MENHPHQIEVAEENPEDINAVHRVNDAAFSGSGEADVVDELRRSCKDFMSLVAKLDGQVVGHILFTPARIIQPDDWSVQGMGLAPLAVMPEYQNKGIGTALCKQGLQRIESEGTPFLVVLGDPGYYSRFGFERASKYGIAVSFEGVPEEVFMIRIFDPQTMKGVSGIVYYQPAFDSVT